MPFCVIVVLFVMVIVVVDPLLPPPELLLLHDMPLLIGLQILIVPASAARGVHMKSVVKQ